MKRPAVSFLRCCHSFSVVAPRRTQSVPSPPLPGSTTCRASPAMPPSPKLKPYGDEFAGNGFQLADKEAPRFVPRDRRRPAPADAGASPALRLEGYGRWQPQTAGRSDFKAPYLLKLLSGGQIARDVSYYFYFFFGERGEVAGLEDAFMMFNNLFGSELDVTVGQFQVSDPLFKRELRLTLEDYQVYRQTVGAHVSGSSTTAV